MNFDLRLPIGILFSLYGLLLTGYGALTNGDKEIYKRSLDININLIWGVVMLAFGAFMLLLAIRSRKAQAQVPPAAKSKVPTTTGV
ncbi:MAG: hypothetical protein JWR19_3482 [Pedosphaera sp.]|nr:hypothetical protein [Pedosphaera sp.]